MNSNTFAAAYDAAGGITACSFVEEYKGYFIFSRPIDETTRNTKCECVCPFEDDDFNWREATSEERAKHKAKEVLRLEWQDYHKDSKEDACSRYIDLTRSFFAMVKKPRQRKFRRISLGFDGLYLEDMKNKIDMIEGGGFSLCDLV